MFSGISITYSSISSLVIPAGFKRESSGGGAGLDSRLKPAGMTDESLLDTEEFMLPYLIDCLWTQGKQIVRVHCCTLTLPSFF
jgi:hypothetical protein